MEEIRCQTVCEQLEKMKCIKKLECKTIDKDDISSMKEESESTLESKMHLLKSTQEQILDTINEIVDHMKKTKPTKEMWDVLVALSCVSKLLV